MQPAKTDTQAPANLVLEIKDTDGNVWGQVVAKGKNFSSGSVGFYANGKVENPDNPDARYQVGCSITLIGSKPKK